MTHADSQIADLDNLRLFFTPAERVKTLQESQIDTEQLDALQQPSTGKHNALESATAGNQKPSGVMDSMAQELSSVNGVSFDGLIASGRRFTVLINGLPCQYLPIETQVEVGKWQRAGLNCPHLAKKSLEFVFLVEARRVQVRSKGRLLGELSVGHSL